MERVNGEIDWYSARSAGSYDFVDVCASLLASELTRPYTVDLGGLRPVVARSAASSPLASLEPSLTKIPFFSLFFLVFLKYGYGFRGLPRIRWTRARSLASDSNLDSNHSAFRDGSLSRHDFEPLISITSVDFRPVRLRGSIECLDALGDLFARRLFVATFFTRFGPGSTDALLGHFPGAIGLSDNR